VQALQKLVALQAATASQATFAAGQGEVAAAAVARSRVAADKVAIADAALAAADAAHTASRTAADSASTSAHAASVAAQGLLAALKPTAQAQLTMRLQCHAAWTAAHAKAAHDRSQHRELELVAVPGFDAEEGANALVQIIRPSANPGHGGAGAEAQAPAAEFAASHYDFACTDERRRAPLFAGGPETALNPLPEREQQALLLLLAPPPNNAAPNAAADVAAVAVVQQIKADADAALAQAEAAQAQATEAQRQAGIAQVAARAAADAARP
jgi:hypothetical protein